MTILTDSQGRPFEKPEPPAADAAIAERIAYLRAAQAYKDAIADCANRAFAESLRRRLNG